MQLAGAAEETETAPQVEPVMEIIVLAARARHGQSGLRRQPGLAGHSQAWPLLAGGNGGGDERLPQWAGVSGDGLAELLPVPVLAEQLLDPGDGDAIGA